MRGVPTTAGARGAATVKSEICFLLPDFSNLADFQAETMSYTMQESCEHLVFKANNEPAPDDC